MDMLDVMKPFVYEGEHATLASRWSRWLRRLDFCLMACKITEDERKVAALLYLGGDRISEIYQSLDATPRLADSANNVEAETRFDATKRVLSDYINKFNNVTYNRYLFGLAKQAAKEKFDTFYLRLYELAEACNFHDIREQVKSQIILTCISNDLRIDAITNEWDLKTLVEKGNAYEQAKLLVEQMENERAAKLRAESNKKGRRSRRYNGR